LTQELIDSASTHTQVEARFAELFHFQAKPADQPQLEKPHPVCDSACHGLCQAHMDSLQMFVDTLQAALEQQGAGTGSLIRFRCVDREWATTATTPTWTAALVATICRNPRLVHILAVGQFTGTDAELQFSPTVRRWRDVEAHVGKGRHRGTRRNRNRDVAVSGIEGHCLALSSGHEVFKVFRSEYIDIGGDLDRLQLQVSFYKYECRIGNKSCSPLSCLHARQCNLVSMPLALAKARAQPKARQDTGVIAMLKAQLKARDAAGRPAKVTVKKETQVTRPQSNNKKKHKEQTGEAPATKRQKKQDDPQSDSRRIHPPRQRRPKATAAGSFPPSGSVAAGSCTSGSSSGYQSVGAGHAEDGGAHRAHTHVWYKLLKKVVAMGLQQAPVSMSVCLERCAILQDV
jgi:hypothetical protein